MIGDDAQHRFGVIATIAIVYVLLGLVFLYLALTNAEFRGVRLDPSFAIFPAFIVLAGIGTLLKRNWGRLLAIVVSGIFLLGVPIGTILGGFMIYYLVKGRGQFLRHHES